MRNTVHAEFRKRYKKYSPSILSCIDRRIKGSCNHGSEGEEVHIGQTGDGGAVLLVKQV